MNVNKNYEVVIDLYKKKEFIKRKYYIICDLGEGKGDIIAHLVGCNDYLEEIIQSDGGIYGSDEIDRKLFE